MKFFRSQRTLAAVAVLTLLAAACGGDDDTETLSATTVPAAEPTVAITTVKPTLATVEPTTTGTPESSNVSQPTTTSSATSVAPTTIPAGSDDGDQTVTRGPQVEGKRVLPSQFDRPISLTLSGEWVAQEVSAGAVILEDAERVAPFTRAVLILSSDPFAAETLDDWASGQELVTVENRQETQISGFDAVVYDLTYDGESDVPVLTTSCEACGGRIILRDSEYYRIWMIDIGADKPLAVFAPVLRDDVQWLDKANEVVDSLQIG